MNLWNSNSSYLEICHCLPKVSLVPLRTAIGTLKIIFCRRKSVRWLAHSRKVIVCHFNKLNIHPSFKVCLQINVKLYGPPMCIVGKKNVQEWINERWCSEFDFWCIRIPFLFSLFSHLFIYLIFWGPSSLSTLAP